MTGRLAAREARSIPPLLYPRNLQILNAGHPRIGCLGFLYNAVASLWRMEKPVNERIQIIMLRLGMISSGSGVRGKRLSGGISWENVIASGDRSSRLWASPLGYGGFYIPPSVPCIFDLLPPFLSSPVLACAAQISGRCPVSTSPSRLSCSRCSPSVRMP